MTVSPLWAAAQESGGVAVSNTLTVTVPGGDPVELKLANRCTVTQSSALGSRWTADLSVAPEPGANTRELVTTPGAVFRLCQTLSTANGEDTIPLGTFLLAARPKAGGDGAIDLVLADHWKRLADARFLSPYTTPVSQLSASDAIADLVEAVLPGVSIIPGEDAPNPTSAFRVSEERDRTKVLQAYMEQFDIDLYFDAEGVFRIDPAPRLGTEPVAVFRDRVALPNGGRVTMKGSETEQPYGADINAVRVLPPETPPAIPWAAFTVGVGEWDDRHHSKVGAILPVFYRPKSPISDAQAAQVAARILSTYMNTSRTTIRTWLSPLVGPGDTVLVQEAETWHEPERVGLMLVESNTYDLFTLDTEIVVRSGEVLGTEEID